MSYYMRKNAPIEDPFADLSIQCLPVVNILLLGETGAGKSTSINAIANYLKYATFEEAKSNEFVHLIPSKFTMPDPKTGARTVINSGSDANENEVTGSSSTKDPRSYHFEMNDWNLRIIDTPGHEILVNCAAMGGSPPKCKECGCPWQTHMHVTCIYVTFMTPIIDENTQREINSKENLIQIKTATVQQWERQKRRYSSHIKPTES